MRELLIVLDLDETLIHATTRDDYGIRPDFEVYGMPVFCRPGLGPFLDYCFCNFPVGVWTSAGSEYAAEVIRHIMGTHQLEFVWSVEKCSRKYDPEQLMAHPTKPIRKLLRKGWVKERILAIDDTPKKWIHSYGNLLRVSEFRGDPKDDELDLLPHFIETLRDSPNVRAVEKRHWRQRTAPPPEPPTPTAPTARRRSP